MGPSAVRKLLTDGKPAPRMRVRIVNRYTHHPVPRARIRSTTPSLTQSRLVSNFYPYF